MKSWDLIEFPHSVYQTGCGRSASLRQVGLREAVSRTGRRGPVCNSDPNRETGIARGRSEMSEIGSGKSESRIHSAARRRSRLATRNRIYARVQAFIKARVDVLLVTRKLEVAVAEVALELGLTPAEVRGIRNGDKRRIDEDIIVLLLPFIPDLLTEKSSSGEDLRQKEISEIRALVKNAALRLDRLEPA